MITKLLKSKLIRYLAVASVIVAIELLTFALMNSVLGVSYLVATPASMLISIVLNWYFGRKLVFAASSFDARTEFVMVAVASVIGIGMQIGVAYIVVGLLKFRPFIGKLAAISVTFFWNFLVRHYYIYRVPAEIKES